MKKIVLSILFVTQTAHAAEITLTIPDDKVGRIRDSYTAATGCLPNETKGACMKRGIIQHIKDTVTQYEVEQATETAMTTQQQSSSLAVVIS